MTTMNEAAALRLQPNTAASILYNALLPYCWLDRYPYGRKLRRAGWRKGIKLLSVKYFLDYGAVYTALLTRA